MGGFRSRLIRESLPTPSARLRRLVACGGWSIGRTFSSRSQQPRQPYQRSLHSIRPNGISVNTDADLLDQIAIVRFLDAFMTGLEQRAAEGGDLAGIESVASFFISRVDTEVDKRLAALPGAADGDAKVHLHGLAALANARLADEVYEDGCF